MDKSLSFSDQFDKIYRKAVERVHLLKRVRQKLTTQAAESIYKSMIQPLIAYSDLIMQCLSESKVNKLERLQDRAETIVFGTISSGSMAIITVRKTQKSSTVRIQMYKWANTRCL